MLLYEIPEKWSKKTLDKVALICGENSCTYNQLSDKMNLWAKTLLSLGIKKGDRVALFMKNSVELVQLYFACFRIGAIAVPLNVRYKTPEAERALSHSGSKILIASSELSPIIRDIQNDVHTLEQIYVLSKDSENHSMSWNHAIKNAKKGSLLIFCSDVVPDALNLVMKFKEEESKKILED